MNNLTPAQEVIKSLMALSYEDLVAIRTIIFNEQFKREREKMNELKPV